MVLLTNMYAYGAEKSANEMYHSWFADGTDYDHAINSLYGPAPGYQPGGFNPNYAPDPAYGGNIVPPQFQPSLKSYKDWNTSWPQNSWEITETSISNQGSYIKLLSKFIPAPCVRTVTNPYDAGFGTFRQAVACANVGDTIHIDLPEGDTLRITSGPLVLDKNLVIKNMNGGQALIYCDTDGTAISIASGKTVHLHHLTFHGTGETILTNHGELHLHQVKFHATGFSSFPLINSGLSHVYGTVEIKP
jgi:hypothetical protein